MLEVMVLDANPSLCISKAFVFYILRWTQMEQELFLFATVARLMLH